MSRRWLTAALTGALVAVLAVAGFLYFHRSPGLTVSASSTRPGLDANALIDGDSTRAGDAGHDVVWESDGETIGAWVALTWPESTEVDHVDVRAAGDARTAFTSATLEFDGGASVLLTTGADGVAAADFPERQVSSARLVIATVPADTTSVALSSISVDDSGAAVATSPQDAGPTTAVTSSDGQSAGALVDGDVAHGRAGDAWTAAADDEAPWAQVAWDTPRQLAAVQVFGPAEATSTPLSGVLRFDDGSAVQVSGIDGGPGTTVAFAPRTTSSVRLELVAQDSTAVSLREFAVYDTGTTPPRWPRTDGATTGYTATPPDAAGCTTTSPPVGQASGDQLALVCPAPGSAVSGTATVVIAGPADTALTVTAWVDPPGSAPGAEQQVADGTTDPTGRATLTVDLTALAAGPTALRVTRTDPGDDDVPLYVQLVNRSGVQLGTGGHAPRGMTLQYDEEFTDPLSISQDGAGAEYAATKPSYEEGGSFGEATFADPADGRGTLATVDSEYLRIRAQGTDPSGQDHESGILSSVRVGGSGFAAQYGYFEARMLGAPGTGSWPAFWMLDTENATPRGKTANEVDAVELYGHNTIGSCHTTHNWGYGSDDGGVARCLQDNNFADWALSWHTYGVRLVPGGAVFSIDGLEVARSAGLRQAADAYYFMVDLALGGGWPVDLSATGEVTDLYVDWVHVYT
ncbi:glycoside hydrolase family 16 protein [Modestobacter excelsi]|uniref:glycoside hydrolase family 16 protein n=1 Tax=Modestobacter excelsi TaxID=2213161 RepID=UPI00110CDD6A|nr:glycoside hydrolase family 16 protein [Modestobacter excelsi]